MHNYSFSDRVKEIAKQFNCDNPTKFSNKTGLSHQTSTNYLNGRTPTAENLLIIQQSFENINPIWFFTGKGEMLREENPQATKSNLSKKGNFNIIEINPEGRKENTLIADAKASAGFGQIANDAKALEKLPAMHIPNAPFGQNIAFQIDGDSMHPTIRHLDFVAGNKIEEHQTLQEGYTYILVDSEFGVLCKRLYKLGKDFQYISDNPTYPPQNRKRSDILAIYKAFARLSFDFRNYHDDIRSDVTQLKADVQDLKNNLKLKK